MLKLCIFLSVTVYTALSQQQCQSGYYFHPQSNKCFKVSTDIQNYFGASVLCTRDGGTLASIQNGYVNSFIGSLLGSEKSHYIGLNSLMQTASDWTWIDGTPYVYNNWQQGQSQGGQCAAIQGGTNQWSNPNCSAKLPYICMTDPVSLPVQPITRHALCETGWIYFNKTNSCYRTFSDSRATHAGAEAICVEGSGGHLTSIHSPEELYFVSELSATGLPMDWPNQVLTGLLRVNNIWTWTDSSPFDFQVWTPDGSPWAGSNYGYLFVDEYSAGKGLRYKFDNYPSSSTTFRAFVCKKPSLP